MEKNYSHSLKRKRFGSRSFFLGLCGLVASSGYAQQTYTFTNATAVGLTGPTQLMVNNAYQSTSLANAVTVVGQGIQVWTVPVSGNYRIETYGAQGGTSSGGAGGLGAIMQGDFSLTAGQTLSIVVGQAGLGSTYSGSGGGGSYVVTGANVPLCIAGGGGGAWGAPNDSRGWGAGFGGVITTTAGASNLPGGGTYGMTANGAGGGAPGFGGNNGWGGGSGVASGGGGLLGDGANGGTPPANYYSFGGKAFVNGSAGGAGSTAPCDGGFGGGGGTQATSGYGGGGGGYAGGGGGSLITLAGNGGGGASFNSGTNQTNTAAANSGNGKVIIRELCAMTLSVAGLNNSKAMCAGNSVTITTDAVSNFTWSNGANTSSIVVFPTVTTAYTLTAVTAANCTAQRVVTITVNGAVPSLTVVNSASSTGGICPTKTVNLLASGAITYTWTGGSPTVTNGVTFAPTAAYDYTVTGENGCGTSMAVTSVSVHPFPTVNPSASSSTLCSGQTLSLTATGNATNYVWSGGTAPSGNGVGFLPTLTSTYIATGTSSLSCTQTAAIVVTVVTTPIALPAASPTLVCIGKSSTLTATGATNYTWTNGVQTANTSSFVVTPAAPGITTYTVTKANANCVDTRTINLTTNALPNIFAIASPPTVCSLQPSTLSIGGGVSYTWTSPGSPSFTFTGASPVVYPSASGVYSVLAFDGNCYNSTTVGVTADPNPTITTSATSPTLCVGQQVTITASGGNSYTWTVGSNTTTGASITDSPTTAVAYNVTGDNNFGCTASAQQIVIVFANPVVGATTNKPLICSGAASTLTASGANTYTWDVNAGSTVGSQAIVNPVSPVSATFIYTVTGSNSATGCQGTKTVQVGVYVPTLAVSGVTNACVGGQISLNATGGNPGSYVWNTGSNTSNFPSLTTTISAAAVFTISATGNSGLATNCPGANTIAVNVYSVPVITAASERSVICPKEATQLIASGGVSYNWSNSMSGATITINPVAQTNNYTVTATDANGCIGTASVQVKLQNCNSIDELSAIRSIQVYPNPNNGSFTIKADKSLNLVLMNELGQTVRVVTLTHANENTISVSDLAEGIYFLSGQSDHISIHQKIVVSK